MRSGLQIGAVILAVVLQWPLPPAGGAEKQTQGQRAKVRVLLPAKAKLIVNGKPTRAKAAVRRFITHPLERGKKYTYTFKAEITRGDETATVARTVTLRAGEKKVLSLRLPGSSSRYGAARRSRPTGATYRVFTPEGGGIGNLYPTTRWGF